MRIGIDYRAVTASPLSGIARQVHALETVLRARPGTEVLLYTAAPLGHPHRAIACCPETPCPVDRLHRPLNRLLFERRFLPAAIERDRLDMYIATINMGLPLGRRSSARLVLVLHDTFQITLRNRHLSRLRETLYRLIDRMSIRHSVRVADAIWVPSRFTAESLASLFPAAVPRIGILPNAVDSVPWNTPGAPPPAELPADYWLVVGIREPRKNLSWFIAQWQRVGGIASLPPLVLIGRAADLPPELAALQGIHFVHDLSDAQMSVVYRNARRVWQPSYAEGFGLPVVEAAACGTPVASARGSSLDEVTPPGAPRFDPHDDAGLQALMRDLARPPHRFGQESRDALRAWAGRYDLPRYALRLERLLEGLSA